MLHHSHVITSSCINFVVIVKKKKKKSAVVSKGYLNLKPITTEISHVVHLRMNVWAFTFNALAFYCRLNN